jgi:hypothetical protein
LAHWPFSQMAFFWERSVESKFAVEWPGHES